MPAYLNDGRRTVKVGRRVDTVSADEGGKKRKSERSHIWKRNQDAGVEYLSQANISLSLYGFQYLL